MAFILPGINVLIRRYPFLLLLSALIAGILLQALLHQVSLYLWLCLCCGTGIGAAVLHRIHTTGNKAAAFRVLSLVLSFGFLGATVSHLQDIRQQRRWYGHYLDRAEGLRVVITDVPQQKEKTLYLPVNVTGAQAGNHWIATKGSMKLYVYRKDDMPAFAAGQQLLIPAKLYPVRNSGNPFAFDYANYTARNGIFHQAFLSPEEVCITRQSRATPSLLQRWRSKLTTVVDRNVTDSATRALILATMLNERAELDKALWEAYSITGIVHIIAISGMHVALLAGLLLFALKWISSQKLDILKYLLALVCIWLYIALTGFPPSAVRAGVMFSLLAAGSQLNKTSNNINTWAAAAFLLLCYNPYWLYDVGVQLSFLAVLSIMLFYAPVKKWIRTGYRLPDALWSMMALSIAAQILVTPLLIYYFHQFPLLGLAANVPAALFSTMLMYGAIGLFALGLCGIDCLWLGKGLTMLTQYFHRIVFFLAQHTPASTRMLYIDRFEYWLMMLSIATLCLFLYKRNYVFLWSCGLMLLLLITDFIIKDSIALQQERIVVYNTAHSSTADLFRGKTVQSIFAESGVKDERQEQYVLQPARLGWRATNALAPSRNRLYCLGHTRILFLDNCAAIKDTQSFSIDFLVVSQHCAFLPEAWYHTFHPKKIIIDGSLPRWKAQQWQQQLKALGAPVHWVQEDGAWVYPAMEE